MPPDRWHDAVRPQTPPDPTVQAKVEALALEHYAAARSLRQIGELMVVAVMTIAAATLTTGCGGGESAEATAQATEFSMSATGKAPASPVRIGMCCARTPQWPSGGQH
jgi:hypothetical protein